MIVDGLGIRGIWCCGECLADIHAISFIRRVEEDVIASIDSRTRYADDDASIEGSEEDG